MKTIRQNVLDIVREIHVRISPVYGDNLRGVYLYGSYARDDSGDDSDIDVAIVLRDMARRTVERQKLSRLASEISLRENCVVTLFIMSEAEFTDKPFAIHRSIAREGVPV
jgi:type I restriction enzyme S subunit